ncbi:MAG TPA: GAF domain-containing sensor histidine kinase [Anaerolineales bacterium]|nr:GAF domain-containing sensor histidine kinase [Anaerolineales bacterium]
MVDSVQPTLLERYQRLLEILRDLASTLDLNVLLNRISQAAADLSNAEAASILLFDENKKQLFFQSSTNLEEPLMQGLVIPLEGSIAGWIVSQGKPIVLVDAQQDPRHFSHIGKVTNITTTSLLGVPLIAKEKVVGVLEAINKKSGTFTQEDLQVLVALGAQAAVAIETTRLFQQSDLIAEMVHELRTPLSSLNTAAHLLLRQDPSLEQRQKVTRILHDETARLIEMTSAFLDLARLESGRTEFHAQWFDLTSLLEECASMEATRAAENKIRLRLEIPLDLPQLKADRDKIKQVLLNLLSNAIKYNCQHGEVLLRAEAGPKQITIEVSDTGPGMRESDLAHLFEKFFRAHATEGYAQGTGLGLVICKRIVEAHRGTIEVESQVGVGTTIRVHLPLNLS